MDAGRSTEILSGIPRMALAPLNTPIDKCERIRDHVVGWPELYVKRDDFIGNLVWGNKLRKIEYSLAEAKRRGADTVITCGGVQSNHARITAQSARRLGFNVILVLNGEKPGKPAANFLINSRLGIDIHFVGSREERALKMAELTMSIESGGKKVYEIPLGASDEIGSLGFVHAFSELIDQEKELGIEFDYLVHSSSSGGTQAGLEVGKRLFGRDQLKIIGISSDNSVDEIRTAVLDAARPILSRLKMDVAIDPVEILVDTSYIGPGYAIPSEQSIEADLLFSKWEGLLLDPTYTAKAAAAIIDYARRGKFGKTDRVLFWHTGGLLNLFQ